MTNLLRLLCAAFLLLTGPGPSDAGDRDDPPAEARIELHWSSVDSSRIHTGAAGDSLEFFATLTGVDTLRAMQIEILVTWEGTSRVWSFAGADSCPAATAEGEAARTAGFPAPWRGTMFIADARQIETGQVRVAALAAFETQSLDPSVTYGACRLRLRPPSALRAGCSGWDTDATLQVTKGIYLDANRAKREITSFGGPLHFRLATAR